MKKTDELVSILTKLEYVNKRVKQVKEIYKPFYYYKKSLLEYLIVNKNKYKELKIKPISITLHDYETLLIRLSFDIGDSKFIFQQRYIPNVYKTNFNLDDIPLEMSYSYEGELEEFDENSVLSYYSDIKNFYSNLINVAPFIVEAKALFPKYTFKIVDTTKVLIKFIDGFNQHRNIKCKRESFKKAYERHELKEYIQSVIKR